MGRSPTDVAYYNSKHWTIDVHCKGVHCISVFLMTYRQPAGEHYQVMGDPMGDPWAMCGRPVGRHTIDRWKSPLEANEPVPLTHGSSINL